jgi:hypothetical protein
MSKKHKLPKALTDDMARIGALLGDEYLQQCAEEKVSPVNVGWEQTFPGGRHTVTALIMWPEGVETVAVPPWGDNSDLPGEVVAAVKRGHVMRSRRN